MSEPTPIDAAKPPPRRRWLWALLIGSLALNLLVAGAIGGWAFRHGGFGGPFRMMMRPLLADLPEEKRETVEAIIARHRSVMRGDWQKFGEARKAVGDSLVAEPFDRPRFEAALKSLLSLEAEAKGRSVAMFGEIGEKLSAEERGRVLKRLRRGFGRRFMEGFGGGPDGPPGPPPSP